MILKFRNCRQRVWVTGGMETSPLAACARPCPPGLMGVEGHTDTPPHIHRVLRETSPSRSLKSGRSPKESGCLPRAWNVVRSTPGSGPGAHLRSQVFKRLRQEDLKIQLSLGSLSRPCLKLKNKKGLDTELGGRALAQHAPGPGCTHSTGPILTDPNTGDPLRGSLTWAQKCFRSQSFGNCIDFLVSHP